MVIDQGACIGCNYCTYGCLAVNDVREDAAWNEVHTVADLEEGRIYLPHPCMHCEHPPCVDVCPVKATYRRPDGLVVMDYDRCIGCRYCMLACPYEVRRFNWEPWQGENTYVPDWGLPEVDRRARGVVEKCTFCIQRIDHGLERGLIPGRDREATPACVVECPVEARFFGDLNDPESTVSRLLRLRPHIHLRDDLGTAPRVYYLPTMEPLPPTEPPERRRP
jgi:Fe-S-cluster-containing dehydrogenase component